MKISRREILKSSIAASVATFTAQFGNALNPDQKPAIRETLPARWSNGMPPIYCTAYIDPTLRQQQGQEAIVAKYPLALIPQDSRIAFKLWRDKVRHINPSIKLLAYQMVAEETTVPGPGHDIIRKINNQDVWVTYAGGIKPTIKWGGGDYRIYDPRSIAWQNAFLDACERTLNDYPFDGLILDNCTVYPIAAPLPNIRNEMLSTLNQVLIKLRKRLPDAIIIANSSHHFTALNGSMNENRPSDLPSEAAIRNGHSPIINLSQLIVDSRTPDEQLIKDRFDLAIHNKCFFGVAAPDFQRAYWPPFFDEVIAAYYSPSPVDPVVAQPEN